MNLQGRFLTRGEFCAQAVADFASERLELNVFSGEGVPADVYLVVGPIDVPLKFGARGKAQPCLDVADRGFLRREDPARRRRARADAMFRRAVGRPPYQDLCRAIAYLVGGDREELDGPQRSVPFVLLDVIIIRDRCEAGVVARGLAAPR